MSKQFNVAIVGATGTIGRQILEILQERDFPVGDLRLLASARSDGDFLAFGDEEFIVQPLTAESFAGIDIAFFCAGNELSAEFCPVAAAAGAVCIDTSAAWRFDAEVPLVVPEVNPGAIVAYQNRGIVASPSSATIPLVVALGPLHTHSPIRRLVVSTYQSVSGSGQKAIDELRVQCGELLNGRPCDSKVYPHQIAFNCLPQTDLFAADGYTCEEQNLVLETQKVLGDESMRITATTVRVPVFYGDSEAVNVETVEAISVAQARELLADAPGVELLDEPEELSYPMPIDAVGQDQVLVGRIRADASCATALNLWLTADNLRKGAATNAVQIAEILIDKYLEV